MANDGSNDLDPCTCCCGGLIILMVLTWIYEFIHSILFGF